MATIGTAIVRRTDSHPAVRCRRPGTPAELDGQLAFSAAPRLFLRVAIGSCATSRMCTTKSVGVDSRAFEPEGLSDQRTGQLVLM
jgi:hypothetical protein